MIDRIIKFFTSLRLTVVLLCFGLVLVFVGTLAQVDEGLYQAQVRYFKSWLVWRPTIDNHALPIVLPGGYLLGTLLLINLLAAHIKRFKFTLGKLGIHLIHGGLILLLLGQLLTDVLSHESAMQLSEGQSKYYSEDFRANELVVVDSSDPQSDRVVSIPESMVMRKETIGDSALPVTLRVLDYWQNCDVEPAAPKEAIQAAADHGVFTNMLLMPVTNSTPQSQAAKAAALVEIISEKGSLGTYLVPARTSEQQQQTFSHNNRTWVLSMLFAPMLGGNQLVIADVADTRGENMITIPEGDLTPGKELTPTNLPVKILVKGYWSAARLYHRPGPNSVQPQITEGEFTGSIVTPMPLVTDSDHRNVPATVVEVMKGTESLGTWLLWTADETHDTFTLDKKSYELAFRFKRYYKPYSIGLMKFSHDIYRGTGIPKNFSSRIRLVNQLDNEDREVLIKMNNPLRYSGTTYYQGGFNENDPHISILQVVTNPSWLTPYFSCVLVGLGLIVQFGSHLVGFARKRRTV